MATWAPAKKDTLDALSTEILQTYGIGRSIVAVDGASDSGAPGFADDLAAAMRVPGQGRPGHRVFRASLDNFRTPRAHWESPDPDSPAAYYSEAFDYSVLQPVLIDPFRASGSTGFVLAAYDAKREAPIQPKWMSAGPDAVLIIDGVFLNRAELAGLWNYSIWLDNPEAETGDGVATRADALYAAAAGPRSAAVAIIDNRDPEHPRRSFADSC